MFVSSVFDGEVTLAALFFLLAIGYMALRLPFLLKVPRP